MGNHGSTVGPYPTYAQCQAALQSTLTYNTTQNGYVVESVYPCHYNPPYTMANYDVGFEVFTPTSGGSHDDATGVLADFTRLRSRYNLDQYETDLGAMHRRRER